MDIRYFLERRLSFIEHLYAEASAPFVERKRKIEAEEEPFVPTYSEDPEPPFLTEWLEAEDSLQVLGRACLSMLAAAFHVYFKAWERQLGRPVDASLKSTFSKRGWFAGYRSYFHHHFAVDFRNSPCDLALMKELVLARNRFQHPDSVAAQHSQYSKDDLQKVPSPFFVSEAETALLGQGAKSAADWLLPPSIHVTADKLAAAVNEIRKFAEWLEVTNH